jgi:hypothetical protein
VRLNGMSPRPAAVLAALLLLSAGCAAGGGDQDRISHPTGPTDLVLRVSVSGGFVGPAVRLSELPGLSLYGDGRVITQGAQTAIFPGRAMPPLVVTRVTDAGMQRLLRAARSAGLMGPDRHYDHQGVADAGTTTFTLVAGGAIHQVSAYALFDEPDTSMVRPEDRQPRRLLLEFQRDLGDLRNRLGSDVAGPDEAYVPSSIRIVAVESDPKLAEDQTLVKILDWPLAASLATFGDPRMGGTVRCGNLEGADLERVRGELTASHTLTFWRSAGKIYQLQLRPLLPDEQGPCPADS